MLKPTAVVTELDDTFIPLASSTIQAFPLFAKSSAIGAIGHLSAMSIRFQQHQSAFKLRFNAAMSTPDYHVYLLNGINAVLSPSSIFGCRTHVAAIGADGRALIAVRVLRRNDSNDYCIRRLRDFTQSITSSYLTCYKQFIMQNDYWYLTRDLCEWDLCSFLHDELANLSIAKLTQHTTGLAEDLLHGLDYLHSIRLATVFHGNLKPENVLIDSRRRLHLCDFGFGRVCTLGFSSINDSQAAFNVQTNRWHPICWKPPEYHEPNRSYDLRSDVYSAGLLIHYMLTKKHPFVSKNDVELCTLDICTRICCGSPQMEPRLRTDAKSLLYKMMQRDMSHRASVQQLLEHPFLWTPQKRAAFLFFSGSQSNICARRIELCTFPGGDWRHRNHPVHLPIDDAVGRLYSPGMIGWLRALHRLAKSKRIDPAAVMRAHPKLFWIFYRLMQDDTNNNIDK